MAVTEQLKKLVDQMPDPDGRGMLTTNVDKEKIEKSVAAIAEGGRENLLGLVEMLGDPGSTENAKPHYALHCVVNHALVAGNEKLRKELCEALASQLGNKDLQPYNRAYLCQELQWAGRDESCAALGKVLLDDDVTDDAATALAAIGGERAASQLRAAVAKAEGKARFRSSETERNRPQAPSRSAARWRTPRCRCRCGWVGFPVQRPAYAHGPRCNRGRLCF